MNDNDTTTVSSNPAPSSKETLMNSTLQIELCDLVEARLNKGERVTILALSKEKNISPTEIRNALVETFGNRVQFKRGRTGGITLV
jgi:hypothetical protein